MKLLILHISDIHFQATENPVTQRVPPIVNAVRNLDYGIGAAAIIVTGDIAFSGKPEEYYQAWCFLEELRQQLKEALSIPSSDIPVFAVPGNHDCYIPQSLDTRNSAIDQILADPAKANDPNIQSLCLSVQQEFFGFLANIEPPHRGLSFPTASAPLYYEYNWKCGKYPIVIQCYNTAWLSNNPEVPRKLLYPSLQLPELAHYKDSALVVAAFHHPYSWLAPEHVKAFRKRIEALAHITLTGHEHDQDQATIRRASRETTLYIEGGALQETHRPERSCFDALVVDLEHSKQLHRPFQLEGGIYRSIGDDPEWEEYQGNKLRRAHTFDPSPSFAAILSDPGIVLSNSKRQAIALDRLFVYPEMRHIHLEHNRPGALLKTEEVLQTVLEQRCSLITGDYHSGRTTVAKALCVSLNQKGYIPLLISGTHKLPLDDRLFRKLDDCFKEQYSSEQYEAYRQFDKARRAILIDDYHEIQADRNRRAILLRLLLQYAGKVVLLANDLTLDIGTLLLELSAGNPEDVIEIPQYKIQEFDDVMRDRLIGNWLIAYHDDEYDAVQLARDRNAALKTLDIILGNNLVPAYPGYILAILQASTSVVKLDTQQASHGYLYELLIRNSLAKCTTRIDFDIAISYLTYMAACMHERNEMTLQLSDVRVLHGKYVLQKMSSRTLEEMFEILTMAQIWSQAGDTIAFRQPYMYYYFHALHLRATLSQGSTRELIVKMAQTIYIEKHANILLFLAHLTHDPFLIDNLVRAADGLYGECARATLGPESANILSEYPDQVRSLVYRAGGEEVVRREVLESRSKEKETLAEELRAISDEKVDASDSNAPAVVRIIAAIKTLQVIGQIVKNFPSLDGPDKVRLCGSCYNLGRRTLSAILGMFKTDNKAIIDQVYRITKHHHPSAPREELSRRVGETVMFMVCGVVTGLVKRVSNAVVSNELGGVYQKLLEQDNVPAVRLIDGSIQMDLGGTFPEALIRRLAIEMDSNPLCFNALQQMVYMHLHLFRIDYKTKQKVCATLKIRFEGIQGKDVVRE